MITLQKPYVQWDSWGDIEPYLEKSTVASNVANVEQARVICLLQPHNVSGVIQKIFNQIIINQLYSPGDVVLVEDDASKSQEELNKSQLSELDFSKFDFRGWDDLSKDPESIMQLSEQQIKIDAAKKSQDLNLLATCLKTMKEMKTNLLYSTWPKRQQSLQENIQKHLKDSSRKVFVLMGPFHGISEDPRLKPTATEFLPTFQVPYSILYFQANFISSRANC